MNNPYQIKWIVWMNPVKKCYIKRFIHDKQIADMQRSPDVLYYVVVNEPDKQMAFSKGYVKLTTSKRKL